MNIQPHKQIFMKSVFKQYLPAIACYLVFTVTSDAALVITDGDITNSGTEYNYALQPSVFGLPGASATQFAADAFSASTGLSGGLNSFVPGVGVWYDAGNQNIVTNLWTSPVSSYSFTYKFDFSTTSYLAESVSIDDRIVIFPQGPVAVTGIIDYSFDGISWVTQRTVAPGTNGFADSDVNWAVTFGTPQAEFYYRVTFSIDTGTFADNTAVQWGRTIDDGSEGPMFSANFATVPEPTSSALLIAALAASVAVNRRRIAPKRIV